MVLKSRSRKALVWSGALVLGMAIVSVLTLARPAAATPQPAGPKVVFVLTTGIENIQQMNLSLRHAKTVRESGYLADVVWIADDRGVEAVGGGPGARAPETATLAREAQNAGVRLIVCKSSLAQVGIPRERLDPVPDEMVPDGITRLAELVSQGYQVIRY